MGYFQVRYDSRVVIYNRRGFIRLATGLFSAIIFTFCQVQGSHYKDASSKSLWSVLTLPRVKFPIKFYLAPFCSRRVKHKTFNLGNNDFCRQIYKSFNHDRFNLVLGGSIWYLHWLIISKIDEQQCKFVKGANTVSTP